MASYARVPAMISQVRAMMEQSYKNTHMFVAVKGISELIYQEIVVPQLKHFVNERRLSLCMTGNTNQLVNFLDTIRGCDTEGYDLFLKIDDDDIYHQDYVKYCAQVIQLGPPGVSTYFGGITKTIWSEDSTWHTYKPEEGELIVGPGMLLGMSRRVIARLMAVERDLEILKNDVEEIGWEDGMDIGWREDRYMFELMQRLGPHINIAPIFSRLKSYPVYIGGYIKSHSFSRDPDFKKSDFFKTVTSFAKSPRPPREWFIELGGGQLLRIFNGYYNQVGQKEHYRYKSFRNGSLELEDGTVYKRQSDGRYYAETPRDSGGD